MKNIHFKRLFKGQICIVPKRNHKYEATKEFEFGIIMNNCIEWVDSTQPTVKVYCQETAEYKFFAPQECKVVDD